MLFPGVIKALERKRFIFVLLLFILLITAVYLKTYLVVPGEITLIYGQEHIYNFKSPFFVSVKADKTGMLELNNGEIEANGSYLSLSGPLKIKPSKKGKLVLDIKIFGLIPLRSLKVDIVENRRVVPCGNTVGVKIQLSGILVVGVSDIRTVDGSRVFPAREANIRAGDLIIKINSKEINSINSLVDIIEKSGGKRIKAGFLRGNIYHETHITPVRASDDLKYHLGLWVRDNTAGIGTLSFYDPATGRFAALGHGISDIDTGTLMPVYDGQILESRILEIRKGKQGIPGELRGVFVESGNVLGRIRANCEYGIYGTLDREAFAKLPDRRYQIGVKSQVVVGKAYILANIKGRDIEEYEIEISRINRQNSTKGMVISITDGRLLNSTGGIVQGMSGSPIIQNGRVIGAVTHVMVNDPSKGYGIFIESMLKNLDVKDSGMLLKTG